MKPEADQQNVIEGVFQRNRARIQSLVAGYLRRPQDVEDIVQETFVQSFQAWKQRHIEHPERYLFRTARNLSLKHLAHSSNKVTDFTEDLALPEVIEGKGSLLDELEGSEKFQVFCEAVRELPEKCARVFVLKKVYGLSHDEISEKMGISVSTCNQHLAKALSRVTAYMRERDLLGE